MPQGTEGENLQNAQGSGDSSQNQQSDASAIDYSKIDWSKIDWTKVPVDAVPESVVKATPTGKSLLEETIQRRQTIKQMKEALGEKPAEQTTPTQTPKPDDMPDWAKQILGEVEAIKTNTQATAIKTATDAAMQQYKLPENARQFLVGNSPDEIAAKAKDLSAMFTPNDTTSPGNPGTRSGGDIHSRAKAVIKARIDGAKPVADTGNSIFDKSFHRIS